MCGQKFYYFAYGSNLLKQRIQLRNPSAVFVGVGLLSDYSLKFVDHSKSWGGAVATIVPNRSENVYGAVWTLDVEDLQSLDTQESVPKMYTPAEVNVALLSDKPENILCRTYQANGNALGQPSPYYLDVILRGSIQCSLPSWYVDKIRSVQHNHYFGGSLVYSAVLKQLDKYELELYQVSELKALYEEDKKAEE